MAENQIITDVLSYIYGMIIAQMWDDNRTDVG